MRGILSQLKPENPMVMHKMRIAPDGSRREMQWINRAIFDKCGKIIIILGIGVDLVKLGMWGYVTPLQKWPLADRLL